MLLDLIPNSVSHDIRLPRGKLKGLYGILSDETLISRLPFIENAREEIEKRNSEKENTLDSYNFEVVNE